jgi:hypothetical protein
VFTAVHGDENLAGILLNPWGESFLLTKDLLTAILAMGVTDLPPIEHQRHPYLDELDTMEQLDAVACIDDIAEPLKKSIKDKNIKEVQ